MSKENYDYVLFIDEAGDDGLRRVKPIDPNGASEWLIVSGILVRSEDEAACRKWIDDIRVEINATQSDSLHYKYLSPTKRIKAAEMLSSLNVKMFVVCSNKRNMRQHHNPKAAAVGGKQWFYNWIVRLIMERATSFCRDNSIRKFGRPGRLKVLFSTRGGHSYGQTKAYWRWEAAKGAPYLNRRTVKWDVVDFNASTDVPHYMHAGLQLADIAASAFYQAVEIDGKYWSTEPAKRLLGIAATENRSPADFGLTLQPHTINQIGLSAEQKSIFEYYGYKFRG